MDRYKLMAHGIAVMFIIGAAVWTDVEHWWRAFGGGLMALSLLTLFDVIRAAAESDRRKDRPFFESVATAGRRHR